jgi:hypothetical protein
LESDQTPLDLGLRADNCSFCIKHQAAFTSDPRGELFVVARDAKLVARYRFGTRTADFILCRDCGVFVAAVMSEPSIAAVNVNVLDARATFFQNELRVASFEGESTEQRLERRRARWTPLVEFLASGLPFPF